MLDKKKMKLLLAENSAKSIPTKSTSSINVADYRTNEEKSLKDIRIYGAVSSYGQNVYPTLNPEYHFIGKWNKDMTNATLNLRIHGENWLDGYEMERILKDINSPCYLGKKDEQHFTYKFVDNPRKQTNYINKGVFLPSESIRFKENTNYSIKFAYNIPSKQKKHPRRYFLNMAVLYKNLYSYNLYGAPNEVGRSELNYNTTQNLSILELVQNNYVNEEIKIDMEYAGVSVMPSFSDTSISKPPYKGFSETFTLKTPLAGFENQETGEKISDVFNPLKGKVTRNTEFVFLDKVANISKVVFENITVFAVKLPKKAHPKKLVSSNFAYGKSTLQELINYEYPCICISDGGDYAYIKIPDILELSQFNDNLKGRNYYLWYAVETPYEEVTNEKITLQPEPGYVAVEACAIPTCTVEVDYI